MKTILALICLFILAQTAALGQRTRLAEGDRVKIKSTVPGSKKVTGTVYRLNTSEIFIRSNDQDSLIPLGSVRRVFVSRGTKRNSFKGMFIGGVSGGTILGVASAIAFEKCEPGEFCLFNDKGAIIISNTFAGALIGGGAGLLVGTFIKTDRWMLVRIAPRPGSAWNHHSAVPGVSFHFSLYNNRKY